MKHGLWEYGRCQWSYVIVSLFQCFDERGCLWCPLVLFLLSQVLLGKRLREVVRARAKGDDDDDYDEEEEAAKEAEAMARATRRATKAAGAGAGAGSGAGASASAGAGTVGAGSGGTKLPAITRK